MTNLSSLEQELTKLFRGYAPDIPYNLMQIAGVNGIHRQIIDVVSSEYHKAVFWEFSPYGLLTEGISEEIAHPLSLLKPGQRLTVGSVARHSAERMTIEEAYLLVAETFKDMGIQTEYRNQYRVVGGKILFDLCLFNSSGIAAIILANSIVPQYMIDDERGIIVGQSPVFVYTADTQALAEKTIELFAAYINLLHFANNGVIIGRLPNRLKQIIARGRDSV